MLARKSIYRALQLIAGVTLFTLVLQDITQSFQLKQASNYIRFYNVSKQQSYPVDQSCRTTNTKPSFHICPHNVSKDIYISRSLTTDGIWEPKMTESIIEILKNEEKVTFLDIGANIGYFSLLAAAHRINVIAVEPVKNNLQKFCEAILINKFEDRVLLLQNIISDVQSLKAVLTVSENNQGAARVLSASELVDQGTVTETAVSITLDDLTGLINTPDVVIKIDVEGQECKVLSKSSQLFQNFNVKNIFMEWKKMSLRKHIYGTACQPQYIQEMTNKLRKLGMAAFDLHSGNELDAANSALWTSGDIIWRKVT